MTRPRALTKALREALAAGGWVDEESLLAISKAHWSDDEVRAKPSYPGRADNITAKRRYFVAATLYDLGASQKVVRYWRLTRIVASPRTPGLAEGIEEVLADGAWKPVEAIAATLPIRPEVAVRQYQERERLRPTKRGRRRLSLEQQVRRGRRLYTQALIGQLRRRTGIRIESRGAKKDIEYRLVKEKQS